MTDEAPTDIPEDETKGKRECLGLADLGSLISLARSSEDHEAYRVVAASDHFRVGLVVNAAPDTPISFRIEVLLQILAKNAQPRIADLELMHNILENLTKRGYSLDHHDSCWVTCERALVADDIDNECLAVMAIVQNKKVVKS
jgi:hypothetical protein